MGGEGVASSAALSAPGDCRSPMPPSAGGGGRPARRGSSRSCLHGVGGGWVRVGALSMTLRWSVAGEEYLFGDKYLFSILPDQQRARSDFRLIFVHGQLWSCGKVHHAEVKEISFLPPPRPRPRFIFVAARVGGLGSSGPLPLTRTGDSRGSPYPPPPAATQIPREVVSLWCG
jgi:hypothetical protein